MTTKRAVLYARYSTDMQNPMSIEDQFKSCQRLLRDGEIIVKQFSDNAISGDHINNRPGIIALLDLIERDASIDLIFAEDLDRLSRHPAELPQIYMMAQFLGVAIRTIMEGDVEDIHVGLKGTMNAIEVKKTSERTRRGLKGALSDGRVLGIPPYGYDMGDKAGERRINQEEAAIVRDIYKRYLARDSIRSIARELNNRGITTKNGRKWTVTTIRGIRGRGNGILQNPIYKGVRIWNRTTMIKHPITGRKIQRDNDPSQWITQQVPDLRIIEDNIWSRVQAQLAAGGYASRKKGRALDPLPFDLTCGGCGAAIIRHDARYLICKNHHDHISCDQTKKIRLDQLLDEVMLSIRTEPERFFHRWKKKMLTVSPNNLHRKIEIEEEIQLIDSRIVELEERKEELEHEMSGMPPTISETEVHEERFFEICRSAEHLDQVVPFISGATVTHRRGKGPVIDDLIPNWISISTLAPDVAVSH